MNKAEIIPYLSSGWRLPVILTLVLVVIALIFWSYSGSGTTEIDLNRNIGVAEGQNIIVGNLIKNQEQKTNDAEKNANILTNELHNSISKPSNQFDGNRANDRYCHDFPDDCK